MHKLGHTRSSYERDHSVITPDTFVRAGLPGMLGATAIVHVAPACGAGFTAYTVEFDAKGGSMPAGEGQTFIYVLEGAVVVRDIALGSGHYAYVPANDTSIVTSVGAARAIVIQKPRIGSGEVSPTFFTGSLDDVESQPLLGDEALQVQALIPGDFAFDFAVNVLTFQPGAALPMVEVHVMEHGLLMLEGGGIYRLNEKWYPVTAGDVIWMAPYCPQWFGAIGKTPAKYLIYKDWNRHPLQTK